MTPRWKPGLWLTLVVCVGATFAPRSRGYGEERFQSGATDLSSVIDATKSPGKHLESAWAAVPPVIDGVISSGEWTSAATMALDQGTLYIMNDLDAVYFLVDLTGDTVDDAPVPGGPTPDYFWLTFDVDTDSNITPMVDVNYGTASGTHDFGLQYYLGPSTWTGLRPTASQLGVGFGMRAPPTTHRIWEMAILRSEIGAEHEDISPEDLTEIPMVRFGLRTYSQNPSFDHSYPSLFWADFSDLNELYLALGPELPLPSKPIFTGVGLVPWNYIVDGYADTSTVLNPIFDVRDAPFGGRLNIFGYFDYLRSKKARSYQVLIGKWPGATPPAAGDFEPLRQAWTAYRWEVDKFVPQSVGPDEDGKYPIPKGSEIWYPRDLLISFNTTRGIENGKYTLKLAAYKKKRKVKLSKKFNQLTLVIDNTPPVVEIERVERVSTAATIEACDIVELTSAAEKLEFTITAKDPEGHLRYWRLRSHWGENQSETLASSFYPPDPAVQSHAVQNPNSWPRTCAYQFRLSAGTRSQNGYGYLHYREYNKHVTIKLP